MDSIDKASILSFGLSDTGKRRQNNEDSILIDEETGLFVLSDGMGGHQGGEIASSIAVETLSEVFRNQGLGDEFPEEAKESLDGLEETARLIKGGIIEANEKIVNRAVDDADLSGMGATVDTLVAKDGLVIIGHVGDSRVFRLRLGSIDQLTRDHSVLNDLIDSHALSPDEARENPYHKRVTNALGYLRDNRVDMFEEQLMPRDIYLLCSDGLTDVVDDEEIANILTEYGSEPEKCCRRLVDEANERGGPDNVSVIVIFIDGKAPTADETMDIKAAMAAEAGETDAGDLDDDDIIYVDGENRSGDDDDEGDTDDIKDDTGGDADSTADDIDDDNDGDDPDATVDEIRIKTDD